MSQLAETWNQFKKELEEIQIAVDKNQKNKSNEPKIIESNQKENLNRVTECVNLINDRLEQQLVKILDIPSSDTKEHTSIPFLKPLAGLDTNTRLELSCRIDDILDNFHQQHPDIISEEEYCKHSKVRAQVIRLLHGSFSAEAIEIIRRPDFLSKTEKLELLWQFVFEYKEENQIYESGYKKSILQEKLESDLSNETTLESMEEIMERLKASEKENMVSFSIEEMHQVITQWKNVIETNPSLSSQDLHTNNGVIKKNLGDLGYKFLSFFMTVKLKDYGISMNEILTNGHLISFLTDRRKPIFSEKDLFMFVTGLKENNILDNATLENIINNFTRTPKYENIIQILESFLEYNEDDIHSLIENIKKKQKSFISYPLSDDNLSTIEKNFDTFIQTESELKQKFQKAIIEVLLKKGKIDADTKNSLIKDNLMTKEEILQSTVYLQTDVISRYEESFGKNFHVNDSIRNTIRNDFIQRLKNGYYELLYSTDGTPNYEDTLQKNGIILETKLIEWFIQNKIFSKRELELVKKQENTKENIISIEELITLQKYIIFFLKAEVAYVNKKSKKDNFYMLVINKKIFSSTEFMEYCGLSYQKELLFKAESFEEILSAVFLYTHDKKNAYQKNFKTMDRVTQEAITKNTQEKLKDFQYNMLVRRDEHHWHEYLLEDLREFISSELETNSEPEASQEIDLGNIHQPLLELMEKTEQLEQSPPQLEPLPKTNSEPEASQEIDWGAMYEPLLELMGKMEQLEQNTPQLERLLETHQKEKEKIEELKKTTGKVRKRITNLETIIMGDEKKPPSAADLTFLTKPNGLLGKFTDTMRDIYGSEGKPGLKKQVAQLLKEKEKEVKK